MTGLIKEIFERFRLSKYAELRVTGPEGGLFYFQYKGQRLQMLDERPDMPYEKVDKFLLDGDGINYPSGDEVLFDVASGTLSPRATSQYLVNTDRVITNEFAQAFEKFLDEMRPLSIMLQQPQRGIATTGHHELSSEEKSKVVAEFKEIMGREPTSAEMGELFREEVKLKRL